MGQSPADDDAPRPDATPLNEGDRWLMGTPGCVRSRARSAGRQQRRRGCKIYRTLRERYNYGYVGVAIVLVAVVDVADVDDGTQSAEARGRREEGARETESEYWTGWQQDAGRVSVTAVFFCPLPPSAAAAGRGRHCPSARRRPPDKPRARQSVL
jgi:hypothetical protein